MSRTVNENIKQKETYAQLAAIGKTTSLVAHDIRTPFSMLKSMLQLFPNLTPEQTNANICFRFLHNRIQQACYSLSAKLSRQKFSQNYKQNVSLNQE